MPSSAKPKKSKVRFGRRYVSGTKACFEMMGMPFSYVLTLGYDPEKKKYVGTWVDSMNNYLWKYEGTIDSTGKVLTLATEGPCPQKGGKLTKFQEVTEFKGDDVRTFVSSMQNEDGTWTKMVHGTAKRKK